MIIKFLDVQKAVDRNIAIVIISLQMNAPLVDLAPDRKAHLGNHVAYALVIVTLRMFLSPL